MSPDAPTSSSPAGTENAVLDVAKAERADRVVLNVWAFNHNAREFYDRLGFKSFHQRMTVELSATPDNR